MTSNTIELFIRTNIATDDEPSSSTPEYINTSMYYSYTTVSMLTFTYKRKFNPEEEDYMDAARKTAQGIVSGDVIVHYKDKDGQLVYIAPRCIQSVKIIDQK